MSTLNSDPVLGVEKDDPSFEPTSLESLFDRPAFPERDPATGRFKKVDGDDDAGDPPAASETQPPAGEAQGDDAGEAGDGATDDGAKAAAGQKPTKGKPDGQTASQPAASQPAGEVKDKPRVPLAAKMAASKRAQDAESELKRLREENAALKAQRTASAPANPTPASSPRQAAPARAEPQAPPQSQARQRRDVFEDTEGFAQDVEAAAAERAESRLFNKALAMSERQARREFADFEEIMGTELVTDPATGQQNPMQRNWLAYLDSLPPAQAEAKRREFYDHPEPVFFAYEETKAWLETRNGEQAGGAQDEETLYAKFAARFRKEMGLDEAPAAGGAAAPAVQPKPAAVKPAAAPAADPPAAPPVSIASRRATGPARGEPSFAGPTPLDAIFERVGKQNRR